jgi:hypothetical protein
MFQRSFKRVAFKQGDWVVFCRMKHKTHPSRRARDIHPAANGDDYSYHVEKFWLVQDVLTNGQLLLQTRRGKQHVVDANDPNLRHATWLDRIRYPSRFIPFQPSEQAT